MKTSLFAFISVLGLVSLGACPGSARGQIEQGDQFLDGMGETALIVPHAGLLVGIPDIHVETLVGQLPRLPYRIPGQYRDHVDGPTVRVIWPAPIDNHPVLEPGTYTVTGTVPGTAFKPKATVSVKPAPDSDSARQGPQRRLEPFPLGQVVLNQDEQGRDTPFIKNRDKFIKTLAKTNPDSFLYMFRNAFGEPQPAGARPLGGWDSQTTRLRGHASGHYLSAMAQAYASTVYDKTLQANFAHKMDYLIDTLYDLSRKSGWPARAGGPFNADPTAVPPGPSKSAYDSDLSENGIRTDYWNWGQGFISAYPPDQFIMLEKGATYGGRNTQIWAPYYTLHKILAGLLDCYEVGGNKKALTIAEGMGLWVYERLKTVPTETRIRMWNRYIAGEYGGMNEVMARLHRVTGDQRFLACARLFDNVDFFFGNARMTGFSCCNGTALESNTKLQDSIYFKRTDNASLYVNLYVPSTLTWPERQVRVQQHTDFPYDHSTRLKISGSGKFALRVRVPRWATQGFSVKINGQAFTHQAKPGTYLELGRTWKDGDTIELAMPFAFYLLPVMDQPNIASVFYGPVLLAAEEAGPRSTWRPVTLDARDIGRSITGDPKTLRFNIGDVKLKPFFESYDRYSVYLDVTLK